MSCTFVVNVRTMHGCPGKDGVHMCSCNVRSYIDLRFDEHEHVTKICKRKESTKEEKKKNCGRRRWSTCPVGEPHARASTASWMTYSMVKKALDESIQWWFSCG